MSEKRLLRIRDHARVWLSRGLVMVRLPAVLLGRRRPGRAAIALLAGLSLFVTATVANAATYVAGNSTISTFYSASDPGLVSVDVLCDSATLRADVNVSAQTPKAYPNGLYFYTQIYVKNHAASQWTLFSQGQSFVKTVSGYWLWTPTGDLWVPTNGFKPLTSTSFSGADNNQYDVFVKYWWAPPGRSWLGPYGLPALRFLNRDITGLALPGSTTCYFDR